MKDVGTSVGFKKALVKVVVGPNAENWVSLVTTNVAVGVTPYGTLTDAEVFHTQESEDPVQ